MPIDTLSVLCARDLLRDLLAIAKFLLFIPKHLIKY